MQAPAPRPLRLRTIVVEVPVAQSGIVQVQTVRLPANAVRLLDVLTTNAVTDQPLLTNLYFFGTGAAGAPVDEAFLLALGLAPLADGFRFVDLTSATATASYFALPARLVTPALTFRDDAGQPLAFQRLAGTVVVNDSGVGVSDEFATFRLAALLTGFRRVWVAGLNLTGRARPEPATIGAPPIN